MSLLESLHLPPRPNRAAAPDAAKAAAAKTQKLVEAATAWRRTLDTAAGRVSALKSSVQAHYAGGPPQLYPEVVKSLGRLDAALHRVDASLADALARA